MIFYTYDDGGNRHYMDAKGLFRSLPAAFLVGGAPSLTEQNYGLLEQRGVVTFAMNNVGGLFRPTCMVASDEPACFDRRLLLDPTIMKFLGGLHDNREIRGTERRFHELPNTWYYETVVKKRDSALLYDSLPVNWKRNTFFLGISVMYHLGIRTILLAGSDFGPDDRGRDYSVGSTLDKDEKVWNNLLYRYEIADLLRLKPMFADFGLTILDTSLHSKVSAPSGPYDRISLEEGVDLCLEGFPSTSDADLPHVSRLHPRSLMDDVLSRQYAEVDENSVLSDRHPPRLSRPSPPPGAQDPGANRQGNPLPVAPIR